MKTLYGALNQQPDEEPDDESLIPTEEQETVGRDLPLLERRDLLWKIPTGLGLAFGYGRVVGRAWSQLRNGDSATDYPEAHNVKVRQTLDETFAAADAINSRPLRVLEVGIGRDCRLIRKGLYRGGFQTLADKGISEVQVVGLDLAVPPPAQQGRYQEVLQNQAPDILKEKVHLEFVATSITQPTPFPDGYFDVVVCCLTLCSVDDPRQAVQEMKRLLRRPSGNDMSGGVLGYVEHVAVEPDEPYRFLEWQQRTLDPLQQLVADNCHLHRDSDTLLAQEFTEVTRLVSHERFLVPDMWPVSMQCRGVWQF